MQHLDNDMDDLFQRAAEEYPLNNGKGDWESIARRIAPESDPAEVIAPLKNKRNKKIISLSLLLFILLVGWFIFHNPATKISTGANGTDLTKAMDNISNKPAIKNNNANISGEAGASMIVSGKNKKDNRTKRIITSSTKLITVISDASFYSTNNIETSNEKRSGNDLLIEKINDYNINFSAGQRFKEKPGKALAENLKTDNNEEISKQDKAGNGNLKDHLKGDGHSAIIKNKKNETPIILQKKKGVYVGIVAGTDFSKVQSRSFNNTGFDAGLLLGYRVNAGLSIETGMIWNKKKYSSEGWSFNMDKVRSTMASGMIINNLESQSTLIEIPIKAKYDFINKRNSALFVAAGISAYIMTKEKNYYNVTLNGVTEKIIGIYENYNYRLPAVAGISIGYEHSVSKSLEIRIEPFLKIPLQGIGVGSLPVTSAGLQVGIISRLH